MKFKDLIVKEAGVKHRDMLKGNTIRPLVGMYSTDPTNGYSRKRQAYYERLEDERLEFNDAIDGILAERERRLALEREKALKDQDEKRIFTKACIIGGVALFFMLLLLICFLPNEAAWSIESTLLEATSFSNFFEFDTPLYISCAFGVVIGIIATVVFGIVNRNENEFGSLIGGFFIIGFPISSAIGFLVVRVLLWYLSIMLYLLVSPYELLVLGALTLTIILDAMRKIELSGNRKYYAWGSVGGVSLLTIIGFFVFI